MSFWSSFSCFQCSLLISWKLKNGSSDKVHSLQILFFGIHAVIVLLDQLRNKLFLTLKSKQFLFLFMNCCEVNQSSQWVFYRLFKWLWWFALFKHRMKKNHNSVNVRKWEYFYGVFVTTFQTPKHFIVL